MRRTQLLAVVVVGLLVVACSSGSGTTYRSELIEWRTTSPGSIQVLFEVENTGDETGEPDCTVRAESPTGSGFDVVYIDPLEPGGVQRGSVEIVVTNNSAQFTDSISIKCD